MTDVSDRSRNLSEFKLEPIVVPIENIILDPNNPRFDDSAKHEEVDKTRYAEEDIQEETRKTLESIYATDDLEKSILKLGFVPFEAIVVKEYKHADGKYVIIEGNRRITAIKKIYDDYALGIRPEAERWVETFEELEVLEFTGRRADEKIIQGIRHVAGPKEWKPYQQAILVASLHDQDSFTWESIQDSLGLGPTVVRRLYNTRKVFEQMRDDVDFKHLAKADLFSLFHEVLSRPSLRDWLSWSPTSLIFESDDNRERLYTMITPSTDDDGEPNGDPTISNPPQMRTFSRIASHERKHLVMNRLADGEVSIEQAWATVEPPTINWQNSVASCKDSLENLPTDAMENFTADEKGILSGLKAVVEKKLTQIERLSE